MSKTDAHESQWKRLEKEYSELSEYKDDLYYCRAQACTRLLENLNKPSL